MSTINDGGPAFPVPDFAEGDGMSLRDWFAGQEGLAEWDDGDAVMSTRMAEALAGRKQPGHGWACATPEEYLAMFQFEADWRAALKYLRADAMLKAKGKIQ